VLERQSERASLEALQRLDAHEFEAPPEQAAVILYRSPEGRIRRVVDHHYAFEIGPSELRHAVERLAEHLRRLAAGRDVNRDKRRLLRQAAPLPQ
jgi:hypothetical protein